MKLLQILTPVYTNTAEIILQHRKVSNLCDYSPNRLDSVHLVVCILLKLYEAKKRRVLLWLFLVILFYLIKNE